MWMSTRSSTWWGWVTSSNEQSRGGDCGHLWRGSLSDRRTVPLGCVAAPGLATAVIQKNRICRICGCCAAEREQAPSPQILYVMPMKKAPSRGAFFVAACLSGPTTAPTRHSSASAAAGQSVPANAGCPPVNDGCPRSAPGRSSPAAVCRPRLQGLPAFA